MVFMKKGGNVKVSGRGGGRGGSRGAGGRGGRGGSAAAPKAAVVRSSSASGRNPFDVRGNHKTKYEVIGKRVKGQGRNVAEARAEAEAKRKKTLGAQFQARNKANMFKDRRLGEQDPTMSLEDKMMARFQTERKRKLRNASAFALHDSDNDDDDDELFLTHRGAKISDDYDSLNADGAFDQDDYEDDDHNREMDREIVNKLHFGGGASSSGHYGPADGDDAAGPDGRKKTHKEIMQEVMLKAKMFKAERQKNKSAQEESTEQLDGGFDAIRSLLEFRPTRANGKELPDRAPMDEFDKLTREFAFEAKAKATERRMSPEEAAQKERDRLAELEKKRIARMKGDDDDDSDDDDGKKRGKKGKKGAKGKTPQLIVMPPTDDDLSSDYALDPRFSGADVQDDDDEDEEEGDEDDEEANDDEDEEDDSEAESDDDDDNDDDAEKNSDADDAPEDDDEEADEDAASDDNDDEAKARARQDAAEELPFVFPCPESPEDLTKLFKEHAKGTAANRSLIIERVITYYSPRISVENQLKMKSFFAILIRQFLKWAAHYAIHREDLDALAKHLFTLAQQMSDTAGVVVRELLINLFKRLHATKARSKWPELAELLLFKALIQIFPTTDLRHNVVSPLETLLGESLVTGAIATRADATQALFACTLMLAIGKDKQRFAPEVLVCVKKLLRLFVTTAEPAHALRTELLAFVADATEPISALPPLELAAASSASAASIVSGILGVVRLASEQYAHLASFDELLHPVYLLLHELARSVFTAATRSRELDATIAFIATQLDACWAVRTPLRLQSFAPSVLPTFTPKFDENYTLRKDKGADRDKAKLKQLQRQVKRARKGAARELRRDAEFLAREKQVEESARIAAKKEKQKEIWQWLEAQNATFNEQVKKGGNMLKGGGSGPLKNRRTSKKQQK